MSGEGCHNPKVKWQTLWNIPQLERLAKSCHRLDEICNESETHRAGCGPVSKGGGEASCLSVCLSRVYTAAPNTALPSIPLLPLPDAPHLPCSLLSLSVNPIFRLLRFLLALAALSLLRTPSPYPHELYPWTCMYSCAWSGSCFWVGIVVHQWWLSAWIETAGFLHLSPYL